MGNIELKTAFKNALKDTGAKEKLGLTAEILLEDQLIKSVDEFIREKMQVGAIEIGKAFPETNVQSNENAEDLYKRQLISELNENYISGFATAESNIEFLKEPSFEKFFTVNSPDSINEYTQLQQQKFIILYALFVEKYKEQQDKKQNFFEYIQKFLEKSDVNQRVQVGLESGFKFSLSLLKEIKSINKDMLVNSLEYLYQTLKFAEPGSLYSTDKLSFMIDSNLNDARQFLVQIIEDSTAHNRAVELAYKIILLLGIVRSNVEDFIIVATLLDKHNSQVDLRQELEIIKDDSTDNTSAENALKKNFNERKTTKSGTIFYLKAGSFLQEIKQKSAFATDGQNIFMHQEGLGLLKMGTGQGGQMIGQVLRHKSDYKSAEQVALLYLNGKLYCRADSLKPKPFVLVNPSTLEEEKDEFELEKEDQNLEWKENSDSGRSLTYSPLFSDGHYIYVVAQKKAPKKKKGNLNYQFNNYIEEGKDNEDGENQEDKDDNKPPQLVIECYDPTTPSFKFVKEIFLYKNEDFEPFIKSSNSVDFIKDSSFATNGQVLIIQTAKKQYFFDLKNGIRTQKVVLSEGVDHTDSKMLYDFQNNIFYSFKYSNANTRLETFTISNFKKGGVSYGFTKEYLSERINKFKQSIYGDEPIAQPGKIQPNKLNLIQRIMKNVTTPVLIQHSRDQQAQLQPNESSSKLQRALILRHIETACHSFDVKLEEVRSQKKGASEIEEQMMNFFKFPNATYLTHTLFQQIQENLERTGALIDSKKGAVNLTDQYSLYFILKILTANFKALSFCSISLPDMMEEEAYETFLNTYKRTIVRLIENGYTQDFEEDGTQDEVKSLWQEIYKLCLNILSTSINLIYSDNKQIIQNLEQNLTNIENEKQAENSSISLNYLSVPENSKKLLLSDTDELKLITRVFEQCCQIKSQHLVKIIKESQLGSDKKPAENNSIFEASTKFIKSLSEQLIVQYCALSEQLTNKVQLSSTISMEREERDKKRIKDYDLLIQIFFEHSANELVNQIKTFTDSLRTVLDEKKDDQWEGINDQYEKLSAQMDSIFQFNSGFFSIVSLYVQTFSVFKLKTNLLPSITQSVNNIVNEISNYYQLLNKYKEKITLEEAKDKVRTFFNSFTRNLCWFVGMTSYKLIKVKEVEKDQEKKEKEQTQSEKMQDLIIQSNLLSGGIENRFVTLFSQDAQTQLQDLIKISQDKDLLELLKNKGNDTEEDKLISAVIHQGENQYVDQLISILQNFLERKVPFVPYAKLTGADGMRLSRAAFGVMIKFSEFFEAFQILVDEVEMEWINLEGDEERDIKIKDIVKAAPQYENIFKRWESASKMRQWINEKKKNLIEKIKKEVEAEFTKKKEEEKKKAEEQKAKEDEEKKKKDEEEKKKQDEEQKKKKEAGEAVEEQKEEVKKEEEPKKEEEVIQIDTSSQPKVEEEKPKEDGQGFTEADKQAIEDLSDTKFNAELQSIYSKIIEKAEFLIRLQVPVSYLVKDPSKKKEGTLLFIKDIASQRESDEKGELVPPEFDWKDRLKSWRQMQTSKGAIKSFTDRKKEIFDSSVMSILACLQTPINTQRIKKQVETVFLNASKRIAGLQLLGKLINLDLPLKHRYDLLSWFASSLRGNKNQMSHYLDDLKGCGLHLEEKARENFFAILRGLVRQLKNTNDESEIKVLLNSLKWKFLARDHIQLRSLELFKLLHEGNGAKDNKLKKAWGRPLKQDVVATENDKKLTKEVIDMFEQVFLLTVGRIIKPDTGAHMKLKQKGTSVPTLEKAQSVIDENVSEHLIGQAFEVIFKEFERYIKIMKMFKGVDWTIYVKMRNKERKNAEGKKDFDDENLLDEEDAPEEKKEEEKKEEEKKEGDQPKPAEEEKKEEAVPKVEEEKKEEEKKEGEEGSGKKEGEEGEKKEGEEGEKKEGEEEPKEEEDLEEKEKQEAIKKQEERAEKEMKSIYKLYSESFLRRLLRLVEIFTSIATVSPYPLSMVQRVANPYQLETLLNLLILSSPRIKIIVLKIIQNLIKIAIPFEVFEETIKIITKDPKSQAYEILNKVVPSVQFEESKFLKFLYNYLLSIRHKMWTKSGIESEGQYAVSQEISEIFRIIICGMNHTPQYQDLVNTRLNTILLNMQDTNLEEVDIWLEFLPGCDFSGLRAGQMAMTNAQQKVIILGFSTNYLSDEKINAAKKEDLEKMAMTMKFQDKSKVVCLFISKNIYEIITVEPSQLTPINENHILNQFDSKEVMTNLISLLTTSDREAYELLPYNEKIKRQTIKSSILRIIEGQIQKRGQEYLDIMKDNGILSQFIQYTFLKSSQPFSIANTQKLPEVYMEMKCFLIRQKALETKECLAEYNKMTAYISNNKYIAFKNINGQENNMVSFPISGSVNIESNIKSAVLKVDFDSEILDLNEYLEIVVIKPELFEKDPERAFRIMNSGKITVTSDVIDPWELFLKMRKHSLANPQELAGLPEKIVIQLEEEDFAQLQDQTKIKFEQLPEFPKNETTVNIMCELLKSWGNCSDEIVQYIREQPYKDAETLQEKLAEVLNPDTFKELKDQHLIMDEDEDPEPSQSSEQEMSQSDQLMPSSESKEPSSLQSSPQKIFLQSLTKQSLEEEPFDLLENSAFKTQTQNLLEKNFLPVDEQPKNLKEQGNDKYFDSIVQIVRDSNGDLLQREYHVTLINLNLVKSRKAFVSVLQYGQFDSIIPMILQSEEAKKNFFQFIKISYNEAIKNKQSNKEFLKLVQSVIKNLFKLAQGNEVYQELIADFFVNDLITNSFPVFMAKVEQKDKKDLLLDNIFFDSEEHAVQYGNSMLFLFVVSLIMKDNSQILYKKSTTLSNLVSLCCAYSIYYAPYSTKHKQKFLQVVLDIYYLAFENVKTIQIPALESLCNNRMLYFISNQLKNEKNSDKGTESQKIIIEIVVQISNLKKKVEVEKSEAIEHNYEITKLLSTMHKLNRVIRDNDKGSLEFLNYYEYYKALDQDIVGYMTSHIQTPHNMFQSPFKIYKKYSECNKLQIIINTKTKLPHFTQLAITSDIEGKNVIKIVQSEDLTDKAVIDVFRNDFYIHYPAKTSQLIAFGTQSNGRLGNGKNANDINPMSIDIPLSPKINIKEIVARRQYAMILDTQDQIHVCGTFKGMVEQAKFKHQPLPGQASVKQFSAGKHSILVYGDDENWYGYGRNKFKHLKEEDGNFDTFKELPADSMPAKRLKVTQFASGSHFTLFVTERGKLYGRGKLFLDSIVEPVVKAPSLIKLPETTFVKKVYCSQSNKMDVCAIIEVIDKADKKRKKFLSAGKSKFGLLGQGQEVKESTEFKEMAVHFNITYFTQIELNTKHAMAISKDGSLYSWGSNEYARLGMEKLNNTLYVPTANDYFKKYKVKSVSLGYLHSVVQANLLNKNGKETGATHIYSIGRPVAFSDYSYLGITEGQAKITDEQWQPWHLKQFNEFPIKKITAGLRSTFIHADQRPEMLNLSKHQIDKNTYEDGILHFYFNDAGEIVKIPQSEFQREKSRLPDVCFAIKYPIKEIEKKQFPDISILKEKLQEAGDLVLHQGIVCNQSNEEIIGARYYTKSIISQGVTKNLNYNEESFFKVKDSDIDPLIYIRLNRPVDPKEELPEFTLSNFYTVDDSAYGVDINVKPDCKQDINKQLINFSSAAYEKNVKLLQGFTQKKIALLKEFINSVNLGSAANLDEAFTKLKKHREDYLALDTKNDENIGKILEIKYVPLLTQSEESYDHIQKILQRQNKHYMRFMRNVRMKKTKYAATDKLGWTKYMESLKSDILIHFKKQIVNKMIEGLPTTSEGSISIKRRKAFYFQESGQVDHEGKCTIFGQVFQQLRSGNYQVFKKNSVDAKVFSVTFAGEGSADAGGPFRDCITNMSQELQSDALPILIRTPNNKNNHGQFRECWIPNPSSKSPTHNELFKFFGAMLGWAIRSTSTLQLDLPPIFWKKILDIQPDEQDLKVVDTYSWQIIEDLRKHKNLTQSEFDTAVDEKFCTLLSDGTEIELCFKGKEKQVTLENVDEFIELLIQTRLNEFDSQMKSIKEGVSLIIPEHILFFMSWQEIDLRATGAKTIDVATLKKITNYSGCSETTNVVKMFWNVMGTLTDAERSKYLKYVWGRSRLPMNLDNLSRKHTIEYYSSRSKDSLPISHTCFFTLDLPEYSSEEILKKRLSYAFTYCGDIDADRGRFDIADEE